MFFQDIDQLVGTAETVFDVAFGQLGTRWEIGHFQAMDEGEVVLAGEADHGTSSRK
jgi:hypothetical protein